MKKIKNALISVYYKDGLDEIVRTLHQLGVNLYSTGGTQNFIESLGIPVQAVESLTGYPSILGGRVKTLHPKVFGGILRRSGNPTDLKELETYSIPEIDLVIVDLYPFEETIKSGAGAEEITEKIDIGGISLIRAAAKNYRDVIIVPSVDDYPMLQRLLDEKQGYSEESDRKAFAGRAFAVSSWYDSAIYSWMAGDEAMLRLRSGFRKPLRYGENPHQKGIFHGNLEEVFAQLNGKELSYNNLLDLDAALNLISEFNSCCFAILKHNNACGIACRETLSDAYKAALEADPLSAFGGVLACNRTVDLQTATLVNDLFFEVLIAPDFEESALEILRSRKNRIILQLRAGVFPEKQYKTILNGILEQDRDIYDIRAESFQLVTEKHPTAEETADLVFANKIAKHTRSNAIVLVKNQQLVASGIGQTSRVDALKQAIAKAGEHKFSLAGAVMASDAFFPFSDSVQAAHEAGITAIVQPGGSVRDQDSIDYCNKEGISMVFTGIRHFKH